MTKFTAQQEIFYSLVNLRSGEYHDFMINRSVEELEGWKAESLEFIRETMKLPKAVLVEKIRPASDSHRRQLQRLSKGNLVDRLWDRRIRKIANDYAGR